MKLVKFVVHSARKRVGRVYRVPERGGAVIALVGPDGAGKSTLVSHIVESLSGAVGVQATHLGKPTIFGLRAFRDHSSPGNLEARRPRRLPWISHLLSLALALGRLRAASSAVKDAKRGQVVIADRWPRVSPDGVDGPKTHLLSSAPPSPLERVVATVEQRIYAAMPPVNLAIQIRVDSKIAEQRNRLRRVPDSTSDVRARSRIDYRVGLNADEVYEFNNDLDAATATMHLLQVISSFLNRRTVATSV